MVLKRINVFFNYDHFYNYVRYLYNNNSCVKFIMHL